jgi:hypothetical protein
VVELSVEPMEIAYAGDLLELLQCHAETIRDNPPSCRDMLRTAMTGIVEEPCLRQGQAREKIDEHKVAIIAAIVCAR